MEILYNYRSQSVKILDVVIVKDVVIVSDMSFKQNIH